MGKRRRNAEAVNRIEGQFVPLRYELMDCRAWKAMSLHARCVYIALKRRVPRCKNTAYLSYNNALDEVGGHRRNVKQSFDELAHYGFTVLVQKGCLGVEGKGTATVWRLTELGTTSQTSSTGVVESPTRDFLKWKGTRFVTKKRPRKETQYQRGHRADANGGTRPSTSGGTSPVPTVAPSAQSNGHAPSTNGGTTSRLATTYEPKAHQ
jgi:hypothetical protein